VIADDRAQSERDLRRRERAGGAVHLFERAAAVLQYAQTIVVTPDAVHAERHHEPRALGREGRDVLVGQQRAVILGDAFPWITFGSAARRTPGDAAAAALGEAAMLWDHPPAPDPSAGEMLKVASPRRHFLWHATPDRSRRWRQRLAETPSAAHWEATAGATDEQIVRELLAASPAAVEVDLAPADVASQGYRVVKIVAPGVPFLQFGTLGASHRHLRRFGLPPCDDIHPFA
jgi:hypothetical protein